MTSPGPPPLVLAAPSGAGKTTIAHALVDRYEDFVFSVSATTRPPRPGERDGVDYLFLTPEEFRAMVERDEFAEWAIVHGRYYGTPLGNLAEARARGEQVVLDIDVQGAHQMRERVPDARLVFILPPSGRALLQRIAGRGTETSDELRRRMHTARSELAAARGFDHFVVNDDLDVAIAEVRDIARGTKEGHLSSQELDRRLTTIWNEIEAELKAAGGDSVHP